MLENSTELPIVENTDTETETETEQTSESLPDVEKDVLSTLIEIDGHLVTLKDYVGMLVDKEVENPVSVTDSGDLKELIATMQETKEVVKVSNTVGFCIGFGIFIFLGFYLSYIIWRRM